jgi:hypothetical protein
MSIDTSIPGPSDPGLLTVRDTGWFDDLTLAEYLSIPAMSASGVELMRRSPAHFRWQQDNPPEPTEALKLGTALHMALLEPHRFGNTYLVLGQCEATKKDRERCTNQASVVRDTGYFCGTHDPERGEPMPAGVEVISGDALDRIRGMQRAIHAHPDAGRFFEGRGRSEVTGVWRDEATGVLCKIRLDRDIGRAAIHSDVKTTRDASAKAFERAVINFGYCRRAAFYRRGMEALGRPAIGSVLIAVEKEPPFGVQTFLLDDGDIAAMQPEIDRALRDYAECTESGEWPAYPSGLRHLKLPGYALPETTYEESDDE